MYLIKFFKKFDDLLSSLVKFDFLILFIIRIFLFFVFWEAGMGKLLWEDDWPKINPEFLDLLGPNSEIANNLNFIFPTFFAWLAALAEVGGAVLLLLGLFTRWSVIPVIFTMFVAVYYHFPNGWNVVAHGYQMAAIYIGILAIPLIYGGGNYLSLDYWVRKK